MIIIVIMIVMIIVMIIMRVVIKQTNNKDNTNKANVNGSVSLADPRLYPGLLRRYLTHLGGGKNNNDNDNGDNNDNDNHNNNNNNNNIKHDEINDIILTSHINTQQRNTPMFVLCYFTSFQKIT